MTAKRPHWEMAGECPPPAAAHHPILPPLASVCGDVFSRMLPMHGAPTLQRPSSGDAFLQPRASWPQLPMPSSEPLRQSTSSTGVVPRVRVTSPEMKRSQHPAGPGFSRQLPLSPSRQDSQSSDASQETPVQDEVDEDDGSASEPTKKPRSSADRWLAEEDEQLRNAVRAWEATSTGGLCPWRTLATRVGGGHSAAQCAQRWRRVLRPELKKGPWIVEHEERLIRLVLELGPMWAKVSTRMGDRSDIQCRYWFRKLRQMGADNWTTADDALLRRLCAEYGTNWRAIAKGLESSTRSKRAHSASACLARVLLVHPSMK